MSRHGSRVAECFFGRDIAFSCHDSGWFLCRDDVAIEVSLSRPRRTRQEVRCCTLHVVTG